MMLTKDGLRAVIRESIQEVEEDEAVLKLYKLGFYNDDELPDKLRDNDEWRNRI